MIDSTTYTATLTLERFAALPMCWPEYLEGCGGGGILLARIHPRNNRLHGDEDVLARALVFIPSRTYPALDAGHLARTSQVTYDQVDIRQMYARTLQAVLTLPVIELS